MRLVQDPTIRASITRYYESVDDVVRRVEYALQRVMSDEFRDIVNAEYNLMLFMENIDYASRVGAFNDELEAYRVELESR